MGTAHDSGAEQPDPIIGPEHSQVNGYRSPSSHAMSPCSKMQGMQANHQQQYHPGSQLGVFHQMQPYIGASHDTPTVGRHQNVAIHTPVVPEQPIQPPHDLLCPDTVTATCVQSMKLCPPAPHIASQCGSLGRSVHSAPVYAPAPDGFWQHTPGTASLPSDMIRATHDFCAAEQSASMQNGNRVMQTQVHSAAVPAVPVQVTSLPLETSVNAEKPAKSQSVSIRIKAFKGSHSAPAGNHTAPVAPPAKKVASVGPSSTSSMPDSNGHDMKPPPAKRKSRGSGSASQGKRQKAKAVREESDDDEEEAETLSNLARSHNIQCHLDAVAKGGIVAQVSDPQTIEADRWRRKCKSTSRFDEVQATTAQRTSGRSRKSTKPQMQRGKVAVSMCTQIQEAAAQQHRFVVRPSHIAGIGVYTKEDIPAKQILLEYQGVIVRRVHADRLEDSYEKAGEDHYLFAVDQSEFIVDATKRGGMARFVNHSCGPNCEVRTVSAEGVRRVVLVSLREIRTGEELCYDYRLNPDPDKAIRCKCRSKRCRGWL